MRRGGGLSAEESAVYAETREFVNNALVLKAERGDAAQYNHLLSQMSMMQSGGRSQFEMRPDNVVTACSLYHGLARCVSMLGQNPGAFSELQQLVFKFDWRTHPAVVEAFTAFLCNLVSVNSCFQLPTFHMLTLAFLHPAPSPLYPDPAPIGLAGGGSGGGSGGSGGGGDGGEGSGDDDDEATLAAAAALEEADARYDQQTAQVHEALRSVLRLVPLGAGSLLTAVVENFPHKVRSSRLQETYVWCFFFRFVFFLQRPLQLHGGLGGFGRAWLGEGEEGRGNEETNEERRENAMG